MTKETEDEDLPEWMKTIEKLERSAREERRKE